MGVVLHHYSTHLGGDPFRSILAPIYKGGFLFVPLFFVLSGYILAQIYAVEGRYPTFRSAVVSRIARLYPLHILTLVVVGALQKLHVILTGYVFMYPYNDLWHLFLNVLMLNDSGLQTGYSFNGPAWSISTEFIVNVVFLGLALAHPRRYIWVGCGLVLFAAAMDASLGWSGEQPSLRSLQGLLSCFLCFGMGLLARAAQDWLPSLRLNTRISDILFLAICGLCAYLFRIPESRLAFYVLAVVCFPALVLLGLRTRIAGSILRLRTLRFLGDISFSLYLVHFPLELMLLTGTAATGIVIPYDSPFVLAVYSGICMAVSWFTWKRFEMPMRVYVKRVLS